MHLSTIVETLGLVTAVAALPETGINGAYTSDLLSDVMGFATEGDALITIQAHKNTIAVATLVGCPAVIICNDRPLPPDMLDAARAEGIAVYVSKETQFTVSGRLFALLGLS